MTKQDLIQQIAVISGLTQTQAKDALAAFCTAVEDELASGGEVVLKGFGTFSVAQRAERQGRNIKTGETITIPAASVPKFKASQALKDAVA